MCIKLKKCAHLEQVAHAIASSSNQQSAQWENFTKACECKAVAVVIRPLQVAGNWIGLVELPLPTINYDSAV